MAASRPATLLEKVAALEEQLREKDQELQRCHKRIRMLENKGTEGPLDITGSLILDSFFKSYVVPWPKAIDPLRGLRIAPIPPMKALETSEVYSARCHQLIHERDWVDMLASLRATCKGAHQFCKHEIAEYMLGARFRAAADVAHCALTDARRYMMVHNEFAPNSSSFIGPSVEIGESWDSLERRHPGFRQVFDEVYARPGAEHDLDSGEDDLDSDEDFY
jgi:hypothetical protein